MPKCSSRSAVPVVDEAERLPCLTTVTPAAAVMMAAIVEMFTVLARSPPVPTMSTASVRTFSGSSTRVALASMASTRPASSPGVSPLARSAIANPAICTGVALPAMISPMAQAVSAVASSSPRSRALVRFGQVRAPMAGLRRGYGSRLWWSIGSRVPRSAQVAHRAQRNGAGAARAEHRGDGLARGDRVERVGQALVDLRVGREPAVGGAGQHHADRRGRRVLVLGLPGDAEAAGRGGLAVQHHQVDLELVEEDAALLPGGGVHELDREVGGGAGADGQPDPVPDRDVVAV